MSRRACLTLAGLACSGAALAADPSPNSRPGPRPLLVLLHGAGDDGRSMLEAMRPMAEARGIDLLLARSAGSTWDLIGADKPSRFGFSGDVRLPSGDRRRIERAIKTLGEGGRPAPSRIGLLGFSDGATYALSLATADPARFGFVAAIAPGGMLMGSARGAAAHQQKVWIAHGRGDPLFKLASSKALCRDLLRSGRSVALEPFDGGHAMPAPVLERALNLFVETRPLEAGCDR